MMQYGSLCSGIEAATVAWHPLGWKPAFFSEIDKSASLVLAHHYPDVPNHGDMTKFKEWPDHAIDLLVGGTPCQSFSVAGLRKGMADPRGNLALTYLAIADRYRTAWLVWENVPGVLSSGSGRDFGAFLGGLGQLGYGWAYRVIDAQYVRVDGLERAVPQRRRRVFVVGCLGGWQRAAAVLFERESLFGNTPPRREAGQGSSRGIEIGPSGGGFTDVNPTLDASEDGTGRGTPIVPVAYGFQPRIARNGRGDTGDVAAALNAQSGETGKGDAAPCVAIQERAVCENPDAGPDGIGVRDDGAAYTLEARSVPQAVVTQWAVRRLTPTECERLQGFPDGYTSLAGSAKPQADGPRYKQLGNSMAVNVMRWIGQRIEMVEAFTRGNHA